MKRFIVRQSKIDSLKEGNKEGHDLLWNIESPEKDEVIELYSEETLETVKARVIEVVSHNGTTSIYYLEEK